MKKRMVAEPHGILQVVVYMNRAMLGNGPIQKILHCMHNGVEMSIPLHTMQMVGVQKLPHKHIIMEKRCR